jgi:hypothetical protein
MFHRDGKAPGWLLLAGVAVFAPLLVAGCGSDSGGPEVPDLDLSTPELAIQALRESYGDQEAAKAISLLDSGYRFYPALPESIGFLGPGETSWDYGQEIAILERLLEPGRINWLDQVLLEVEVVNKVYSPDSGMVEVLSLVDLGLLVGATDFQPSHADIVYVYRRDSHGNYLLLEEHESLDPDADLSVGEQKARVIETP